jgi:hypothetical protein
MKLRIDTAGCRLCAPAPEPRIAFDSGQPKVDRETGLPLWQVQLMALDSFGWGRDRRDGRGRPESDGGAAGAG